jgi:HEPN/Toprim N-terminal domain 1
MGSHSLLSIDSIKMRSVEDDFDPTVMILFDETDKRVRPYLPEGERNQQFEDWEEFPENFVEYSANLAVVKDRLEFMGFTMPKTERIFQEGVHDRLNDLARYRTDPHWTKNSHSRSFLDQEEAVWKALTFEKWLDGFKCIVTNKLFANRRYRWRDEKSFPQELPLTVRYMLDKSDGEYEFFGFPSYDCRAFIRAALEIVGTEGELSYDLTEPIEHECFNASEDFCVSARWRMSDDPTIQKVVVLTEGKSDIRVLEGSLRLLYPHLANYYSFMDFEVAKVPGSASELVKTVKAFIGAGISNRIVAFFDNDTAARSAMRVLNDIKLPENVRILQYPDIQIATNYPTLGPQGTVIMNVNRLAGSLELYLGLDVLQSDNGSLTPIQWRGYDEALKQYQGEVLNKGNLQAKFEAYLQLCHQDKSMIEKFDWSGIQAILGELRTAFHEK